MCNEQEEATNGAKGIVTNGAIGRYERSSWTYWKQCSLRTEQRGLHRPEIVLTPSIRPGSEAPKELLTAVRQRLHARLEGIAEAVCRGRRKSAELRRQSVRAPRRECGEESLYCI